MSNLYNYDFSTGCGRQDAGRGIKDQWVASNF